MMMIGLGSRSTGVVPGAKVAPIIMAGRVVTVRTTIGPSSSSLRPESTTAATRRLLSSCSSSPSSLRSNPILLQHKNYRVSQKAVISLNTPKVTNRRWLSSSSSTSSSSTSSAANSGGSAESGGGSGGWVSTLLINGGWLLLGLVTIDQLLQYKQDREAEEHRKLIRQMQHEANMDSINSNPWMSTSSNNNATKKKNYSDPIQTPAIFKCKINHIEPMLDGTKMLPLDGLRTGSVVEILEEHVGHQQAYHLCRWFPTPSSSSNNNNNNKSTSSSRAQIGWYPIDFLDRI